MAGRGSTSLGARARPGKAACSFPQGIVEIVLRIIVAVLSVVLIVTSGCVLGLDISYTPPAPGSGSGADNDSGINIGVLEARTASAGAIALAVGVIGLLWEVVALLLRFLNIRLLNQRSKIVLTIDVVTTLMLALNAAGVLSVAYSPEWEHLSNGNTVLNSLIATIVFSFLGSIFRVVLAIYMIVYIVKGWNREVVRYTTLREEEEDV